MKHNFISRYIIVCISLFTTNQGFAQRGYFDAPYTRYEADSATLLNATPTSRSFSQTDLQSEASNQVCVDLSNANASVEWTVISDGDGLVIRYSIPDGESGELYVFVNNTLVDSIELTSYYSWEYLSTNGNPNNVNVQNDNPKMRFDEVRVKLQSIISTGHQLKLERKNGNIHLDFAELELVPSEITTTGGDATYTGDGSDLQNFIDANGGGTIYLPAGVYNVNSSLYFGVANTVLKGAGEWFTQIHFTNTSGNNGGLVGNAENVSYSGLYLSTVRNSRSNSYKGINGVYTSGSTISHVWVEHFETGGWIAQFNSGSIDYADGLTVSYCRFRNNYADGINLSKGSSNCIVEHCSFRNNGDDDMAIWPANGMSCDYNTFRYNTSENCWRASGCAIYGGAGNSAHHLYIKDNLEVGLKVNNSFSGSGFSNNGVQSFSDITIIHCGTFNDLFNNPVGAIDIGAYNVAGTSIDNIQFSNIDIIDSKNDAIYIHKASGDAFNNIVFEHINIDGTGFEYPYNNANGLSWGRGYGVLFVGYPDGYGSYCDINYANLGGWGSSEVNDIQQGDFVWSSAGCGTYITSPAPGKLFSTCDTSITIEADASSTNGAIKFVEFYADGYKIGEDTSTPYSIDWKTFSTGSHTLQARSVHEPSNSIYYSPDVQITVEHFQQFESTATEIVIDGVKETAWDIHGSMSLLKIIQGDIAGEDDLSAYFKITYDNDNLYLLVDVTDDQLVNDGGFNWQNDAVEVFIDINNDKNSGYGVDDFAYTFAYDETQVFESDDDTLGVEFVQLATSNGYVLEVSIPWSTLGTTPIDGMELGLDIHVNDDDDGGARNAKKAWYDCDDDAWNNPASLGSLIASDCGNSGKSIEFISFTGDLHNNNSVLDWSTVYSDDQDFFEVQRDDSGLGEFIEVATVLSDGTVGENEDYSHTDYGAPGGVATYRISNVYNEGCFVLSDPISLNVLSITTTKDLDLQFYPNPFHYKGQLILNIDNNKNIVLVITDLTGKVVSQKVIGGYNTYTIGQDLKPGIYYLGVTTTDQSYTIKIVKE